VHVVAARILHGRELIPAVGAGLPHVVDGCGVHRVVAELVGVAAGIRLIDEQSPAHHPVLVLRILLEGVRVRVGHRRRPIVELRARVDRIAHDRIGRDRLILVVAAREVRGGDRGAALCEVGAERGCRRAVVDAVQRRRLVGIVGIDHVLDVVDDHHARRIDRPAKSRQVDEEVAAQ